MDRSDEQKRKAAEATARYRAKQKALGIELKGRTAEQKAQQAAYMAARRAKAQSEGRGLPGDGWAERNPDRHRENTRRWRSENLDYARTLSRINQETRRSTPWGRITNNMMALVHRGARTGRGVSKYLQPLGYSWADLRSYIEAKFTPSMCWENWGDVWELDHIKPVSAFRYESLEDPLFRECWALSNLRPLPREENASKGAKHP